MQWEHIQAEVRRARQSRFEQTVTQRDLVDSVSQILFRADPVGINFETNTDEYDAEAETIVIGLPNTHGPEDVNALTHETSFSGSTHRLPAPSSGTPRCPQRFGTCDDAIMVSMD
ncbi:hypothetical protein ABN028_28540 [Actinopolymorpha sp. B17G11]|uniref:hypothetical protein n=1 Tax=Actinopolymorpha sp. B17G11 TaxID=3160861 RepID=UPI0032E44ACC